MNDIANTISQQLGGALMMLGAHNLLALENGLQFKIRGSKKISHITITLDPSDTYTLTFSKVSRDYSVKMVRIVSDVYADSIKTVIQVHTGLYTSL